MLGLVAGTSAGLALAPALRVLTWPLLGLTLLMLGRGWYVRLSHGGGWQPTWSRRSGVVLILSTTVSGTLWGLRFAGLLGMPPF